jgi:hypothetical protein
MKILILILILLIAIIYIRYYTKVNIDTKILQANLYNLNYNILQEKYPIVINDKVVNINDIINKTFKHLYSKKFINTIFNENIKQNLGKYCLFHNNSNNDMNIYIANPINSKSFSFKNSPNNNNFITASETDFDNIFSIKMILKPYNVLIIPYGWLFKCTDICSNYFLFDTLNILIANYKNKFL